jgi:hypothetical protein
MRVDRIAPARQLAMFTGQDSSPARWDGLPEQARARVLALLARMIARSVLGPGAAADPGRCRRD